MARTGKRRGRPPIPQTQMRDDLAAARSEDRANAIVKFTEGAKDAAVLGRIEEKRA